MYKYLLMDIPVDIAVSLTNLFVGHFARVSCQMQEISITNAADFDS